MVGVYISENSQGAQILHFFGYKTIIPLALVGYEVVIGNVWRYVPC